MTEEELRNEVYQLIGASQSLKGKEIDNFAERFLKKVNKHVESELNNRT